MPKATRNPKVDAFFASVEKWQKEMEKLRAIALECGLTEELKWGAPCYTVDGRNVVLIHGFKEYCALLFFKGALLKDSKRVLVQQTSNVQAARQIRFTNTAQITKLKTVIKAYIKQATALEKAGARVTLKKTAEFDMPAEFREKLAQNAALKEAFEALTPGRQRGYILHFASAKQATTREARIEKCLDLIFASKGLND